ncbi:MAG TPA: PAS domain S-box protein [Candidatus Binatia bacterium]|nr:PAS domain S-box protein [Candidatus Binatia bacterium]
MKTPLARVVGIVLLGMTVFEAVQSHLVPQLTLWHSQVMTILFSGLTAAVAALVAIRHQHRLQQQLLAEIRQRGQTETILRENQRVSERLTDTLPDVVYLYDIIEQRIRYVNQQMRATLGYDPEEFPRQDLAFFATFVHPEDFGRLKDQHQSLLSAAEGTSSEAEYRVKHANGEWRWVRNRLSVVRKTPEGKSQLIGGAAQDITERKAAEDALQQNYRLVQAVIESIPDVIFVKDLKGRYLLLNSAGARLFNRSVADVLGKTESDVLPPVEARQSHSADLHAMLSQTPETTEETFTIAGDTSTYQTTRTVYRDAQGIIVGLIGIGRDITERKQMDEAVRRAHAELETRVQERIAVLTKTSLALQAQIAEHGRVEQKAAEPAARLMRRLQGLASEPTLDSYFAHVLAALAEQFHAFSSALYLYDLEHDLARLHMHYGNGQVQSGNEDTGPQESLPATFVASESPLVHTLTQTLTPLVIDYVNENPLLSGDFRAWAVTAGVKSLLVVPLFLDGKLVGTFSVHSREPRRFRSEEIDLARAFAHQATLALQITQLAEQGKRSAVLEERNRMAREIHDTLSQGFTGIIVQLEAAEDVLEEAPEEVETVRDHIALARTLARESLAEARRSVWELRPQALEHGDLPAALSHLVRRITLGTALRGEFLLEGSPRALPPDVEEHFVRISQEALANVLQHAQAHTVRVTLTYDPHRVLLCVEDDGQGTTPVSGRRSGFGLISMKERSERLGGGLTVTSRPGHGTKLLVTVPSAMPRAAGVVYEDRGED